MLQIKFKENEKLNFCDRLCYKLNLKKMTLLVDTSNTISQVKKFCFFISLRGIILYLHNIYVIRVYDNFIQISWVIIMSVEVQKKPHVSVMFESFD